MNSSARLLGLAFAAADVLFEAAEDRVLFAVGGGVTPEADPARTWPGRRLEDLIDPSDRSAVRDALAALRPGGRSPPLQVALRSEDGAWIRRGSLRFFALPELAPAVSCAILWNGPAGRTATALLDARGMLKRLSAALSGSGQGMAVEFVEVPGLDGLDPPHQRACATIRDRLQAASWEGASAAALTPDRFAVLRASTDVADLGEMVREAGRAEGVDLAPVTSRGEVPAEDPALAMRTLRLALEACLKDGAAAANFGDRLRRTVREADRFRTVVRQRSFTLAYQPIVALDTRAPHHFEALVRFEDADKAPLAAIAMAEELGLTEAFDLAVAETALAEMRRPGSTRARVAVNVSAASLTTDAYVEGLLRMTAATPEARARLLVEITETAALQDPDAADRRLAALRAAGVRVCLDDFGVGAASLDHLRRLKVDLVKIDGSFVRQIGQPRTRAMAAAVVDLCRTLDVPTVAEMVETEAEAAALQDLGVHYGQGWLFGRPGPTPSMRPAAPVSARRRGEVVGWG